MLAEGDTAVVDVATSREYRNGHVPGSWFAVRSRFAKSIPEVPKSSGVILTSDDGILARLAATEAAAHLDVPVGVLDGGTLAWKEAGLPVSDGFENLADDTDDVYWRPHEGVGNEESAMREYLDWESGLVDQVEQDGTARFKCFP
jgi:rhodanese-related sulfurtransferase